MSETIDPVAPLVSSQDVAKGAGTTLLARLGGVLDVITQPLYIWLFGLAGYGFYGALWSAINLAENVADLGMTSAMQRVVPQAGSKARQAAALRSSLLLGITPCLIIAIVVTLLADPVSRFFNADAKDTAQAAEIVALFVWALPLWAFVEISTSALRSQRVFGAEIRLRIFWEQIVRLVIVVALFAGGMSTKALFIGHLASLSVICVLCIRLLSRHFDLKLLFKGPFFDDIFMKTLWAGLSVQPVNMTMRLFGDGPAIALNAIIPGAGGAVATSLYIIARKISSIVQTVRTAFAYVLAPLASSASTTGKEQVQSIYGFSSRLLLTLATPLGFVLAAMGPALLPFFSEGAEAALVALVVLLFARILEAVFGAAAPIQQVMSKHADQLLGSVIGVAVAALIAWAFVPQYGLDAMAAAVATGLVIAAATPMAQLHFIDGIHPFHKPFLSVAIRSLVVSIIGFALALAVPQLPPLAQRLAFVVLVIASYKVSWKLSLGLGLLGVAELIAEWIAPANKLLPQLLQLTLLLPILLGSAWASLRIALPHEDRIALGKKTAARLKLV